MSSCSLSESTPEWLGRSDVPLVIDAHIHLFDRGFLPSAWHDATAWRWSVRTFPPRDPALIRDRIEEGLADPDGALLAAEMDRVGMDAAVCLPLDWGLALGESEVGIDEIHDRYQALTTGSLGNLTGRFFSAIGVDPRRPGAYEMVSERLATGHFVAVKLYPPCGYYPYEEVCHPIYELCLQHGVPVIIHTATVGYPMRTRFAHPFAVNDVQSLFPDLQIILAHAGHGQWAGAARQVAARHPGTYLELSNWNEDFESNPEGSIRSILAMRDAVGAHRILFGSDHFGGTRFSGGTRLPGWIDFVRELPERAAVLGLDISAEEVGLILGENANRLFKLGLASS